MTSSNNWDSRWVALSDLVSSWSKDKSTKVGAVLVSDTNDLLGIGWNGFCRGIDDNVEERHAKPTKYFYTAHAEENALYNAARLGISTVGCRIYVKMHPCSRCARGIIQAGIKEVICPDIEKDLIKHPTWQEELTKASEMLKEAGVAIRYLDSTTT